MSLFRPVVYIYMDFPRVDKISDIYSYICIMCTLCLLAARLIRFEEYIGELILIEPSLWRWVFDFYRMYICI